MNTIDTINSIMNGEKGRFWNVLLGTVYVMLIMSVLVSLTALIVHVLPDSFVGMHDPHFWRRVWGEDHWVILVGLLLYSFSISLRAYGRGNDSTGGDSAAKPEVSK